MNRLGENQKKSFDRSIDRAVARSGFDEDRKLSLYIRVAESRIYHGQILLKALLKEVIYLRLTDLHEGDLRIPKWTPWSKDYRKYEGWTYAGQQYLADRVGCTREAANRALNRIIKDGYLKTRRWRDRRGAWHRQYFSDEAFIDAKIAKLSSAEVSASDVNSDGTPRDVGSLAHVTYDHIPRDLGSLGHVIVDSNPRDVRSQKGGLSGGCLEVGLEVRSLSTPPAASPSGIVKDDFSTPTSKTKTNPVGATSSQAKAKTTPTPTPRPESLPPGVSWAKVQAEQAKARGAKECACGHWDAEQTHFCDLEI